MRANIRSCPCTVHDGMNLASIPKQEPPWRNCIARLSPSKLFIVNSRPRAPQRLCTIACRWLRCPRGVASARPDIFVRAGGCRGEAAPCRDLLRYDALRAMCVCVCLHLSSRHLATRETHRHGSIQHSHPTWPAQPHQTMATALSHEGMRALVEFSTVPGPPARPPGIAGKSSPSRGPHRPRRHVIQVCTVLWRYKAALLRAPTTCLSTPSCGAPAPSVKCSDVRQRACRACCAAYANIPVLRLVAAICLDMSPESAEAPAGN